MQKIFDENNPVKKHEVGAMAWVKINQRDECGEDTSFYMYANKEDEQKLKDFVIKTLDITLVPEDLHTEPLQPLKTLFVYLDDDMVTQRDKPVEWLISKLNETHEYGEAEKLIEKAREDQSYFSYRYAREEIVNTALGLNNSTAFRKYKDLDKDSLSTYVTEQIEYLQSKFTTATELLDKILEVFYTAFESCEYFVNYRLERTLRVLLIIRQFHNITPDYYSADSGKKFRKFFNTETTESDLDSLNGLNFREIPRIISLWIANIVHVARTEVIGSVGEDGEIVIEVDEDELSNSKDGDLVNMSIKARGGKYVVFDTPHSKKVVESVKALFTDKSPEPSEDPSLDPERRTTPLLISDGIVRVNETQTEFVDRMVYGDQITVSEEQKKLIAHENFVLSQMNIRPFFYPIDLLKKAPQGNELFDEENIIEYRTAKKFLINFILGENIVEKGWGLDMDRFMWEQINPIVAKWGEVRAIGEFTQEFEKSFMFGMSNEYYLTGLNREGFSQSVAIIRTLKNIDNLLENKEFTGLFLKHLDKNNTTWIITLDAVREVKTEKWYRKIKMLTSILSSALGDVCQELGITDGIGLTKQEYRSKEHIEMYGRNDD